MSFAIMCFFYVMETTRFIVIVSEIEKLIHTILRLNFSIVWSIPSFYQKNQYNLAGARLSTIFVHLWRHSNYLK